MRTTLDLDDDILQAAKELAAVHRTTAGKVLSDLARKALTPASVPRIRNGVPLFPQDPSGRKITMQMVNDLRDADE